MTNDQIRVRITVTVTTKKGRATRSSLVERIDEGGVTFTRLDNWTGTEGPSLVRAARTAADR